MWTHLNRRNDGVHDARRSPISSLLSFWRQNSGRSNFYTSCVQRYKCRRDVLVFGNANRGFTWLAAITILLQPYMFGFCLCYREQTWTRVVKFGMVTYPGRGQVFMGRPRVFDLGLGPGAHRFRTASMQTRIIWHRTGKFVGITDRAAGEDFDVPGAATHPVYSALLLLRCQVTALSRAHFW